MGMLVVAARSAFYTGRKKYLMVRGMSTQAELISR